MLLKKKLIAGVLALGISLSGATSAFAYDGWADTKQTAYQLQAPILGNSTVLNTPYDVDWYSWTNNTGVRKGIAARLQSPTGLMYDFLLVKGTDYNSALQEELGGWVQLTYHYVEPGETVYFAIRGRTFNHYSTTANYNFSIWTV
ncbi:hypothetical protein [Paenibacillus luteus]|uniref:hypothetical protein n=1 Tax=Paenibacillus luteus TaxID=2545753 RepID=UPI001143982A|nr:hypothetical protein [Paenibacillus luteus]